jgi:hypothetical protein
MTHVVVPDEEPRKQHVVGVTPTTGPFAFDFVIFNIATDVAVYNGAAKLVYGTDYTVAGNAGTEGGFDGGSVTLTTPVSNATITIERVVPYDRLGDFPNAGPFNIVELNTQLDRLITLLQQVNFKLRLAALQDATTQILDLKLPGPAPNQPIGWNALGTALTNLAVAGLGIPVTIGQGGTGALTGPDAIKNLVAALSAHANLKLEDDQLMIWEAAANQGRKIAPQTVLQPALPLYGYRTGFYHFGIMDTDTTGTVTISANNLYAIPFQVLRPYNFQAIGCHVTTGVVGGTIRLGVYKDDGNGYPGALAQDVGTVTTDVIEVKELLASIPLKTGPHWLALLSDVAPQLRRTGQNAVSNGSVLGMVDALLESGTKRIHGLRGNQTFGVLPTPFPAGFTYHSAVTNSMPRVFLKS